MEDSSPSPPGDGEAVAERKHLRASFDVVNGHQRASLFLVQDIVGDPRTVSPSLMLRKTSLAADGPRRPRSSTFSCACVSVCRRTYALLARQYSKEPARTETSVKATIYKICV